MASDSRPNAEGNEETKGIQRWEARCIKLQGEVDSAEAQLEGLRAELQEGSAKLEAAKQTAADIRREEASVAEETANWYAEDYASGQTREAIHDAADHVESVGAELAATAENWADGAPGKEKLCELLAHMEAAAAALDKAKCLESKSVRYNLSDHEEGDSSGDDGSRSGGEGAMDWGEGSWTDQQWAEWRDQQARMQQQLQQDRAREEERERFATLQQDHFALQGQLEQARMCQQRVQEGEDARRAEELRAQQAKLEELQRTGRHQELAMALASCEAEAVRTNARADAREERETDAEKQQAGDENALSPGVGGVEARRGVRRCYGAVRRSTRSNRTRRGRGKNWNRGGSCGVGGGPTRKQGFELPAAVLDERWSRQGVDREKGGGGLSVLRDLLT